MLCIMLCNTYSAYLPFLKCKQDIEEMFIGSKDFNSSTNETGNITS